MLVDCKTASALNRACGCARYAYNWARDTWFAKKKEGQKMVTCAELRKEFNEQKTDWMYESPKGSMDQAIKNFVLAKKRHYEHPELFGFPKRKKYKSKRSFYIENDKAKLTDECHIKLPHIKVPVRMAEPVRAECLCGKINNFVVSKGTNDLQGLRMHMKLPRVSERWTSLPEATQLFVDLLSDPGPVPTPPVSVFDSL